MSETFDEQATAQHYLVYGNEDYQENVHQPLCDHWKDEHVKSPKTSLHEVVFTDTANINFLWRNAIFIQHETLTFVVKNAKLRNARNAPHWNSTKVISLMTSKKSTQKNMHFSKLNFQKSKNISYRHHLI